jgi:CubicO group peptidase (beta-lactamase class C family)
MTTLRSFSRSCWSPCYPVVLLLGSLVLLARSQPTHARAPLAVDAAAVDQFIAGQMASQRIPGLALAITQGDQVLYLKGYGSAGGGQQVTPQTQFLIASLSKSFTALAVIQLVDAGQIDLDEPVRTYLPDFTLANPDAAAQITVRQLLNHTSGLADTGFPQISSLQSTTIAQQVDALAAAEPVAAPGTEFHYFDGNYQVLARVVEVVSGEPFSDYLQMHVFAPLQMADTFSAVTSDEAKQQAQRLAQGHLLAYGVMIPAAELSGYIGGSGGVITSAQDMANYLIMQSNGGRFQGAELVTPAALAAMHTPPPGIDTHYAMGWLEATSNGLRILEHNGVLSVYYAEMVLIPETRQGFALLYNISALATNALAAPSIKHGLIALLAGRPPTPGRFTVTHWSIVMALITLLGVGLAVRSLVSLPTWPGRTRHLARWRLVLGIVWTFVPAGVLAAVPALVRSSSGRSFNHVQLFRSMVEIYVWLGICGVLGVINGLARIILLLRRSGR